MMAVSAVCALVIGLVAEASAALVLVVGLVWGFSVIGDSRSSRRLSRSWPSRRMSGPLGFQMAVGFALTVPTIWLLPFLEDEVGWRWAFVFLVPGPVLGIFAMLRLRRLRLGVP